MTDFSRCWRASQPDPVREDGSLGQLTAGIAHEIKNPLNFVNNFAGLSSELLDELKDGMDALLSAPDASKREELQETVELLNSNPAKILEHGRRADRGRERSGPVHRVHGAIAAGGASSVRGIKR